MARYSLSLSTWANAGVEVETDADPATMTESEWQDHLLSLAVEELPGLCHQCSGGRYGGSSVDVEIGDEWKVNSIEEID